MTPILVPIILLIPLIKSIFSKLEPLNIYKGKGNIYVRSGRYIIHIYIYVYIYVFNISILKPFNNLNHKKKTESLKL